jgi:hypothetical protein
MAKCRCWIVAVGLALGVGGSVGWTFVRWNASGESMAVAAQQFLETLSPEQRAKAALPFDHQGRTDWHFIPKNERKGVQVRDMSPPQRKAALALLQAALSAVGYQKATRIMELESLLKELEKNRKGPLRDPERYFFTVFGTPGPQQRWGLSVEGHHLSLNFVIEQGRVVASTPSAFCANPAIVMNDVIPSIPKGTRVLAREETLAYDLLASLSPQQRRQAVVAEKAPPEVRAAGAPQPAADPPQGIRVAELTPPQRAILQALIEEYANNFPPDVARDRLAAVEQDGPDKTFFAWAGSDKPGEGHYYCIQGPSFQIEFVNVQPDSAGNPANHIHSVWRDMRGDFGIPR